MPFELPQLPYSYDALEPFIDSQTMEIHHTKHHQIYINNLNNALASYGDLQDKSIEELITNINTLPTEIQTSVRNNGGGHYNHSFFWGIMTPNYSKPESFIFSAIEKQFGSFESFKEQFKSSALARFGSGWAWLTLESGDLKIVSTPNQDNPKMENPSCLVLLGLDVWEHAYYLKYQNKRADYIDEWWNIVNWKKVDEIFQA